MAYKKIDIKDGVTLDEIMYKLSCELMENTTTSSDLNKFVKSFHGSTLISLTIPKNNVSIGTAGADVEQMSTYDIQVQSIKGKVQKYRELNKEDQEIEILDQLCKGNLNKILNFYLQNTINKEVSTTKHSIKSITNNLKMLLKESKDFRDSAEDLDWVLEQAAEVIIEYGNDFKKFYKKDFIDNPQDRFIIVKSNIEAKNFVQQTINEINKFNKTATNKIDSIDVIEDYLDDSYNYDCLIMIGNTILSDEIKAGFPEWASKYEANWKSLQDNVSLITAISANSGMLKELVFDMDKELWKNSNEYKIYKELSNGVENVKLESEYELKFINRFLNSTIDITTFPEVYLSAIINREAKYKNSNDIDKQYNESIDKKIVSKDARNIIKEYKKDQSFIKSFCNIHNNNKDRVYSIQIDYKIALPYIQNEVRELNFKMFKNNLLKGLKEQGVDNLTIKNNSKVFDKLLLQHNKVKKENIYLSTDDFLRQLSYNVKRAGFEGKDNVITELREKLNQELKSIKNDLTSLENCELQAKIKNMTNKTLQDLGGIKSENARNIIKNTYSMMELTLQETDKDRTLFGEAIKILQKIKEEYPLININEILSKDNVTTQNDGKAHVKINQLIEKNTIDNMSQVASNIYEFQKDGFFNKLTACRDYKEIAMKSNNNNLNFYEELARGIYKFGDGNNNTPINKLSESLQLKKSWIKLCNEFKQTDNQQFINTFKDIIASVKDDENNKYKDSKNILKIEDKIIDKIIDDHPNKENLPSLKYMLKIEEIMKMEKYLLKEIPKDLEEQLNIDIKNKYKEIDQIKPEKYLLKEIPQYDFKL